MFLLIKKGVSTTLFANQKINTSGFIDKPIVHNAWGKKIINARHWIVRTLALTHTYIPPQEQITPKYQGKKRSSWPHGTEEQNGAGFCIRERKKGHTIAQESPMNLRYWSCPQRRQSWWMQGPYFHWVGHFSGLGPRQSSSSGPCQSMADASPMNLASLMSDQSQAEQFNKKQKPPENCSLQAQGKDKKNLLA